MAQVGVTVSGLRSLLVVCGMLTPVFAQEQTPDQPSEQPPEDLRLEPSAGELAEHTRDHFVLHLLDEKVGWLMHEMGPVTRDDEDVLIWRQETHMAYVERERNFEQRVLAELVFSREAPHELVLAQRQIKSTSYIESIVVRMDDSGAIATIEKAGRSRTVSLPDPEITYADLLTPHLWVGLAERQVGDSVTFRTFDIGLLQPVSTATEVSGIHESDGGNVIYEVSVHGDGELSPPYHFDRQGRFVGGSYNGFDMKPAPEDVARVMEGRPANLRGKSRWKLDKRVGDPTQITGLVLVTADDVTDELSSGPLQDVMHDPDTGLTTLSLGAAFGELESVTEGAREAALAETAIHPIHDDRVHRLAQDAIREVRSHGPRSQLTTLLFFVDAYLENDVDANPPTVFDIMDVRRGDCTEHSLLFVTLARSLGHAAREVDGYVHGGDHPPRLALHRWVEVDLDGRWHSMDPSWSEIELNATHVRLGLSDGVTDSVPLTLGASFKVKHVSRGKKEWNAKD